MRTATTLEAVAAAAVVCSAVVEAVEATVWTRTCAGAEAVVEADLRVCRLAQSG
jgi:hypothetical protein